LFESLVTLITTTALLFGSPGPAPLALAATGATFGVRQGLPFLFGILAGLSAAIIGATVGLAAFFAAVPSARFSVQLAGALYIIFIAYKIAIAPTLDSSDKSTQSPPRFRDGFILNLLNPKAYAAFLAIFSQFILPFSNSITASAVTGLVCLIVAAFVDVIWLYLGGQLRPLFEKPKSARLMRVIFAILMIIAVAIVLIK